jgi:hypothetical protein
MMGVSERQDTALETIEKSGQYTTAVEVDLQNVRNWVLDFITSRARVETLKLLEITWTMPATTSKVNGSCILEPWNAKARVT